LLLLFIFNNECFPLFTFPAKLQDKINRKQFVHEEAARDFCSSYGMLWNKLDGRNLKSICFSREFSELENEKIPMPGKCE
jgi:hypothetical protein